MRNSAHKITATTQKFIEIEDIVDNIVLLSGSQACLVIEVVATNFTLQSKEEQQVKIFSYASLLNSLSFSIQIVILSRRLDISSYLKLLEEQAAKTQNQMLSAHINLYKDFVAQLVQKNAVLDKKFYIALSYSPLEKGAAGIGDIGNKQAFVADAKNLLNSKAVSITQELQRIGLKSKILEKNELTKLYYEVYNSDGGGLPVK
ncbi:MAG: hypothetical protein HYW63_01945 [Candidatus Levybacteria bacterium]|nr:hypothetical protein [Candidatus Levybacteria bacterium]